ncbi:hypothetical protein NW762_012651 [Fusarium torreyae]|uniref:Zn(2)-C6 fungal-type domain-containing protein n=1 Tax=Fusarium torreyae TaxID=1237075 RepID=A0A9W8RQD3_9HYPO|nr:hypothetical protein NW762_012651 [Fusarium torreyae]
MPKRVRPASDGGSADTNEDLAQLLDNSERGPSKRLQHNPTVKCLVSDENDRCRRCSKRNLTCVISKNLQTIIDEKTCFQDRVMNDLKEICSAIRQLQKLSNVSQLPPLQVSSDKAVALEKPSAALSPRPTTPPSTAGHGEGSISPIDGSAENAAVDDGRAHESNGGPETSPSAYYPPPESLSPIHLSHEEPFFQENGTMENDTNRGDKRISGAACTTAADDIT